MCGRISELGLGTSEHLVTLEVGMKGHAQGMIISLDEHKLL
jgi:hypothetical protein